MIIAYLFREGGIAWIPFLSYEKRIFSYLLKCGGIWDEDRFMFIFQNGINPQSLNEIINIVCVVTINKYNNSYQVYYYGLLENVCKSNISFSALTAAHYNDTPEIKIINQKNKEISSNCFSDAWCQKLINEMRSRKYSIKTQDAYVYYNKKICLTLKKKPEDIDADDVKKYLSLMENDKNYSASSLNLSISALKFFYKNVMGSCIVKDQKRPNQNKSLPMILSSEEIKKVLNLIKNPKHRLLIMLVYSSGLRVNEVVTLKKEHIDLSRKVIFIKSGKGRKDRYTMLSDKAAFFINKYFECFNIDNWIFPGQKEEKHLSVRAAQHIFSNAVEKASIDKKISIHNLRHTFATHLLETGIDIRYIQSLLGHANLRTTERYTHVAKRNVLNIKSPLDSI